MKYLFTLFIILSSFFTNAQQKEAYKSGEWLQFRVHYGVINAGYASIEVDEEKINNQSFHHVTGKGWTTGMLRWVFPVKDNYQSFINRNTGFPERALRKVKEGKYTKNVELLFHKDSVTTIDHKRNQKNKAAAKNVQDLISAFYYLRNNVPDTLKTNESVAIDMFFDGKMFPFKLVKIGEEVLKTKFGKVNCTVFRPLVQSGRVFKKNESLTLWVTKDENKIPVRIQADLAVGSLKADIHKFKGLSHPFNIVMD